MSFTDQITLSIDTPTAVATNTVDYDLASYNGAGSTRRVAGLALDEPEVLTVSHETVKSSGAKRHMVRFDHVEVDGTDPNIVGTISAYVVIVVPKTVATETLVGNEIRKLANFLSTPANLPKILNEEI